jgi:cytochrome c-type biogenesis protein CcmH/NrfF
MRKSQRRLDVPPFSRSERVGILALVLLLSVFTLGAGDTDRYNKLGHQFMCVCGCNQILIECNHVGCSYSTKMLAELRQGVDRGDSDQVIFAAFTDTAKRFSQRQQLKASTSSHGSCHSRFLRLRRC